MMLWPSCKPRCAIGLATIPSMLVITMSDDFENSIDFDRGISRQCGDAYRRAGMASLFPECGDHEIGRSVHHFRAFEKTWVGTDETTETHDALDLVEVADCCLDLCK